MESISGDVLERSGRGVDPPSKRGFFARHDEKTAKKASNQSGWELRPLDE